MTTDQAPAFPLPEVGETANAYARRKEAWARENSAWIAAHWPPRDPEVKAAEAAAIERARAAREVPHAASDG